MMGLALARVIVTIALLAGLAVVRLAAPSPAQAQDIPLVSRCLAMAENDRPPVVPASFDVAALDTMQVALTYITHSTFVIESARGLRIATDFAGAWGPGRAPDVVTMNHAHSTHYTDFIDPEIKRVLRGWNPAGGAAQHDLKIDDVHIRNVPTNIRSWRTGGTEEFGNSIFVFDVAGLCIGHLGHLHHELTMQQLGHIGQLDVVLFPVDGTYTLDHPGMVRVLKQLRARLVIPMHYFGLGSLNRFLEKFGPKVPVRFHDKGTIVLSQKTMPQSMQVLVLKPWRESAPGWLTP